MPALKARIGGTWVNVGGADEVFVGAAAPTDPNAELWYDTSAVTLAAGLYGVGTQALRPAAPSQVGFQYWATDTQRLQIWNGSTWAIIAGKMPRVQVTSSTIVTVPNATMYGIPWNQEDVDTDNFHDLAVNTDRLTVPTSGRYRVEGTVSYSVNATGTRAMWILMNGGGSRLVQAETPVNSAAAGTSLYVSKEMVMAAGDYAQLIVFQSSGGNLNLGATPLWFAAQYLGPN